MCDRDYSPDHEVTECNKKLSALLEKLNKIDTRDTKHLAYEVDDCKALARELSYEAKFLHTSRR
jgi:hypothetical protein